MVTGGRSGTISEWETDAKAPSFESLVAIVRALDLDGHWLLTGEGEMERRSPTDAEKRLAKLTAAMREPL